MSYANCRRSTGGSGATALIVPNAQYVGTNILSELSILSVPTGMKPNFMYQIQVNLYHINLDPANAFLYAIGGLGGFQQRQATNSKRVYSQYTLQFVYGGSGFFEFLWINDGANIDADAEIGFSNVILTELGEVIEL
jgi:hypothetical protein